MDQTTCSIDGCDSTKILARGWCTKHYKRWYRHGDPLTETRRRCPDDPSPSERLEYVGWTERYVRDYLDTPCWEWRGLADPKGYGRVWDGDRVQFAHRYSYMTWVALITSEEFILHKCDNPPCMNPAHLMVGDDVTNTADKMSKKRQANGELTTLHKLSDRQVAEIRASFTGRRGEQAALARKFKVSPGYISMLVRNLSRKEPTYWATNARMVDGKAS